MDTRGWPERWDELEEKADPSLMPLIVSLRADMELFAAAAVRYTQMGALALRQRSQILDAQAIFEEHNLG